MQGTGPTIFFGKADVDGVIAPRILGRLPVLAGFSSWASGLLPFPIYDKVFRCETTFLLTRLPAGIHPRWSHQVYSVGFLTGDQQFGIKISCIDEMIGWEQVFCLQGGMNGRRHRSIRDRAASAACRSDRPSTNCSIRVNINCTGERAG
jgi:hypothetical protein